MKILTFDIGGTSIKRRLFTDGTPETMQELPTNAHLGGTHIIKTIASLIRLAPETEAVGISTAGQVNPKEGSIIYANSNIPGYTGTPIRAFLEKKFGIPVMVENDVNSAAIGEAVSGSGKDYSSFLCLTYGTGVGGAIVENKAIYHGSSFSAGEFGGIITHGSRNRNGSDIFDGSYERYASTTALVNAVSRLNPSLNNGRAIFQTFQKLQKADETYSGSLLCSSEHSSFRNPSLLAIKSAVDGWIDEILLGLITLVHIFNPPCLVLGGGIMEQPYIIEEIRRRLYTRIMPGFSHVRVFSASLGNTAGLLGIHYLTLQYLAAAKE